MNGCLQSSNQVVLRGTSGNYAPFKKSKISVSIVDYI